ncbi:hypothetical protein FBY35_1683 [Streptomyces sp. SLBN-118]|uniref:hypothetical protein n=1 Tax=Streptomyces sp. SLBN-118 TaxID=2768454 RepID=UPI001152672A|nr:hypothetical protein [Streptomyces sp. SLBN-118]TQK51286.1 hypothetical protein FBY35_1683 [Streptomyces sp. SLBN-118]
MSTAPSLNGQVIGRAHYATRAVLDSLLAREGITFHQVVALNASADAGGAVERDRLVGRMTSTLKIDESAVLTVIAELTRSSLVETLPGDIARVALTERGRALQSRVKAGTAKITERLYGDLPAEDLSTTGRVLTLVTARANAEAADTP